MNPPRVSQITKILRKKEADPSSKPLKHRSSDGPISLSSVITGQNIVVEAQSVFLPVTTLSKCFAAAKSLVRRLVLAGESGILPRQDKRLCPRGFP